MSRCLDCYNTARRLKYKQEPERFIQSAQEHRAARKIETIQAYGGKCSCCNESNIKFLSIDHVGGNGNEHRRKVVGLSRNFYTWLKHQGYPKDEFQVLCYNCNLGRAFNYKGGNVCPHKENNA